LIFTSIFQLLGVKEEMVDTSKAYRAVMPPCRLQLFPRASPFKAPPNALDWVRLYHKPENLGSGGVHFPKPYRRWHQRLKIKCRRDLGSAIYGTGVFEHRSTIMGFFDRTQALNAAHRALAFAIGHLKRSLSTKSLPEGWEYPPLEFTTARWHRNLPDEILARIGDSWSLQREIEKLDHAIEGLIGRTKTDPLRLTSSKSPEGFVKVFWENPSNGESLRWLRARSRGKQSGSPDDRKQAELEKGRRALVESHKKLVSKVKSNEALLAKALEVAKEALGSCERIPCSQESRTRFPNIRVWNPDSWPISGGSELRVRKFQLPPPSV
jgi:hypothetical protein